MPPFAFAANFFRAHAPESMARLLAFAWFLVGAGYIAISMWQRQVPDFATLGLISTNCLSCLGLRSKTPVATAGATTEAKADV